MSSPIFSVVMPAYNAASTVGIAVRSVLCQTFTDHELIVVDDGSTDNTSAEVRRAGGDSARVRLVRQENVGPSAARNHGIRLAQGAYVAFLDADDLYLPTYLEAVQRMLQTEPDLDLVFPLHWSFDEARGRIRKPPPVTPESLPADRNDLLRLLLAQNFITARSTARREMLQAVGGFREDLLAAMDYELWMRVVAHGYRVARLGERLVVYRRHRRSISADRARVYRNLVAVYRAVAEEYPVPDDVRELAWQFQAKIQRELETLVGPGARAALRRAVRRACSEAVRLKEHLLEKRLFYDEAPPPVLSAFPELFLSPG